MRLKCQIPGWAILVLALAVALAAVITIAGLRQQADESQQAVILLSRLEVLSNRLSALEWGFERRPVPEVLEEVQAVESQIAQTLDGLMQLDPGDERLQRLSKAQLEFEASMDETFRLIAAGDFEKAEALDRGRIDPTFDLMSGIIANASAAYSERAQQAQRASDAGTAFVVIAAGAMIGFLSLRFQKAKLRAELIAVEQKALRKAHDELEIRVQERTAELAKTNKALESEVSEHKLTEESLKLFSEAVEEASNGVQITDFSGHIIYSNRAVEEIYGFSPAEYKGKHVNEMNVDPEFASKVILSAIKETGRWAGELMVRHKDGHIFPIWLTTSMIRDSKGEPIAILGIITDITERKRIEEELKKSILQQNAILSNIPDIAWLKDRESRFIAVNKPFAEACGMSSGDLAGKTDLDIWPGDLAQRYMADDREVMVTGRRKQVEEPMVDKEGKKTWIETIKTPIYNDKDEIIGTTGIARDITERKSMDEALHRAHGELELRVQERTAELVEANKALQAEIMERKRTEESLKQSEEKYHTLVDNIQDGVFIIQEAKVQFINEAFARMSGYTMDEVIGKDFRQLVAPEDWGTVTDRYHRRQAGEDVLQEYEFRILHKDGRTRIIVNMNVGLITYRGKVASMGTVKDITEKKKLEAQLLRAQRMESIGTLAGGIAHDLNNVLTPMMLSLQILQEKFDDEQSQRLLNILETNTQRGANLIKQVMSFVRGIEGERTALQIAHIIAEIEKIAKETFPKSIEIRTDIQRDLPVISGDATQLHQVLMNLCVNARDAMPQGGILGISAEYTFVDESYARINLDARVGQFVTITVTDTGTGIPPEILSRIFEPFFTTKEFGRGTGLGLSTVLGIVKGHGGFIDVYSEVRKGTAFKVYLPAAKAGTQKAQEQQQHELPSGHGELVFVVDDETEILEITRVSLEKYGYRVLTANDGAEAIRLYSQNKGEVKIVLMDMMMPVMDGPASIRALRKIDPAVKVIGVSGLTEKDKIIEDADVQVHAFLTKPYTTRSLLRTIYEVLKMK
ncbi:MAG: PAS domain S-box protein [Candidatus Methanoperedens sp.]|nr:PAS domain S-box protein [Candidatus Methanoperedens sp.]